MKFSVTIPAYKSQFLDEAIKSVVCQTYSDWELIIVDDCSPENLEAIVRPYLTDSRIHYYRNEKNCGAVNVVDNWNICLSYCIGDYVICIGDDDRLLPCCLEELGKLIHNHPNLNVYHLQTEIIDDASKVIEVLEERPEREDALSVMTKRWRGRKQYIGDFCYYRKHLVSCGGYYYIPYAWGSDDVTLFNAALPSGIANSNRTCFQYRENRYSISLSHTEVEKVSATLLMKEWHKSKLTELLSQGTYTKEDIQEALIAMNHFIEGQIVCQIKRDLKRGGFNRYWFWLRNYPKHTLSHLLMMKVFINSIIETSWQKEK